jgi:hypothetical protein
MINDPDFVSRLGSRTKICSANLNSHFDTPLRGKGRGSVVIGDSPTGQNKVSLC